eukprot:227389-Prorocentrum_minimum.AAC.1
MFSRRINATQEARAYSHDGPIGHRKRGYVLTTDQPPQEARVCSHDGPIGRRKRLLRKTAVRVFNEPVAGLEVHQTGQCRCSQKVGGR